MKARISLFQSTSEAAQHPTVRASVPAGYKIIGGGAKVDWSEPGSLLTKSFPEGNAWVVESKDHFFPSPAKITAFAIALLDPDDQWDVAVVHATGPVRARPEARAVLPNTHVMTGGGARSNWRDDGNLLTASYPDSASSWVAKAKDHVGPSPSTVTAYVIGIRPRNDAPRPAMRIFSATSEAASHPSVIVRAEAGYVVVGGGALDDYGTGFGNLLTASFPSSELTGWAAAGKEHGGSSRASVTAYAIGLADVAAT